MNSQNTFMSVKEASILWNISQRRISALCKQGRIEGAVKEKNAWRIPIGTEKPLDRRYANPNDIKQNYVLERYPLPVGISNYKLACSEYYYIDKTMMIKDFLDERPLISLFTRPRRFGKSLNMDMLKTFFEKTDEDTSVYFRDKLIWKQGKKYQEYQGKYPVIYLTFKDVKQDTWESTLDHLIDVIADEFKRHFELIKTLDGEDLYYYKNVIEKKLPRNLYDLALNKLSRMLHEHHKTAPVIIIDEYDTPIHQGFINGFYDEVVLFVRNLFSGGMKDNKHLSFGFLTGILRIAKESMFSGLNNVKVNSVLDPKYSSYFGFTEREVREMTRYYGVEDSYSEICEWYNGYTFGNLKIFNPWSVINYLSNDCRPNPYWQSTGSNAIIGDILTTIDEDTSNKLVNLLNGDTVTTSIDTAVVFPTIKTNPTSIFSFLLVAGYLTADSVRPGITSDYIGSVSLPNKEIAQVYRKEILEKLCPLIPTSISGSIQELLYTGDVDRLETYLERLLLQSCSYFDTYQESFFHGLLIGLTAMLEPYIVESNRESGLGRFDIRLTPRSINLPGIIIELKVEKNATEDRLKSVSLLALSQIEKNLYDTDLKNLELRR